MARRDPSDPSAALARVQAGFTGGFTGVLEALKQRREQQNVVERILFELREKEAAEERSPERIIQRLGIRQAEEAGRAAQPPGGFSRAEFEQPQALEQVFAPVRQERVRKTLEQFGLIKPRLSLGEEIVQAQELSAARARGTGTVKFGEKARQDIGKLSSLESSLGELENLAGDVRRGPVIGRFVGAVAKLTGGKEVQRLGIPKSESEAANIYNRIKPGLARGFYRTLTGDDRISDRDAAEAALPFIPDLSQDPQTFQRQITLMRQALSRRRQSILEAQRLGLEPPVLTSPEFMSLLRQSDGQGQAPQSVTTPAQRNAYNAARARGLSKTEARQAAGF